MPAQVARPVPGVGAAVAAPVAQTGDRSDMPEPVVADAVMEAADAPARRCLNCFAPLVEPLPRYCGACGQETRHQAPTIGEFIQQFGGSYLSTEGALWRTLGLLMFRPGELTRRYLAGRRRHYVLPLRLYLTISVITLLLFRVLALDDGSLPAPKDIQISAESQNNLTINLGSGSAGLKDGRFFCDNLPPWACHRLQRRMKLDPKALAAQIELMQERFVGNLGAAMFVMLPGFALWMKLVYLGRRMRYTEHLVFALHLHAFWFVALALMLPGMGWLIGLAVLAIPIYALRAMKRVYGGRFWPRLLRAVLVSMLYGVTLALVMAGVALWTLLS